MTFFDNGRDLRLQPTGTTKIRPGPGPKTVCGASRALIDRSQEVYSSGL